MYLEPLPLLVGKDVPVSIGLKVHVVSILCEAPQLSETDSD